MKATVIVDNNGTETLSGEWGLSILIEKDGKTVLLDTGASELFLTNLAGLGFDVGKVDLAVLSHAHYDHGNGIAAFFGHNPQAPFYLQEGCGENCYTKVGFFRKYIGLPAGTLEKYRDRIRYCRGKTEIAEDIFLLSHTLTGEKDGKRQHMAVRDGKRFRADAFCHEQSLVIRTEKGLVIFNSCSHGGVDKILREVSDAFPGEKLHALIGGFHLIGQSARYIHGLTARIADTGIERLITGHCTEKKGFALLKKDLGDRVEAFRVGMVMEF